MKYFSLFILTVLFNLQVLFAQEPWRINNYTHSTQLKLDTDKQQVSITVDGTTQQYALEKNNGKWKLKDAQQSSVILNNIGIDAVRVNDKYVSLGQDLSAAEKLINRTAEMPDKTLRIEGSATVNTDQEDGAVITTNETSNDAKSGMNYWWLLPVAGIGVAIGYVMRGNKKPKVETVIKEVVVEKTNKSSTPKNMEDKYNKLVDAQKQWKQESADLKKELTQTKAQLKSTQQGFQQYFDTAYLKLVQPAQQALDKGDKKELLRLALQTLIQYGALTRIQVRKKLPTDEANINVLVNDVPNTSAQVIHAQTPKDHIPNTVQAMMDIMQTQQVESLGEHSISGYKIENI